MNNLLRDVKRIKSQLERLTKIQDTKVEAKENNLSVTITATNEGTTFETGNIELDKLLNAAYKQLQIQIAKQQNEGVKQMQNILQKHLRPLEKMKKDAENLINEVGKNQ